MEQENTELYMKKLKESIEINQALLLMQRDTQQGLNDFNSKFQTVLHDVLEQLQAMLPFFESLNGKLSAEENQLLIQLATRSTSSHQQFFEIWKEYKDLEIKSTANLSSAAEKIKAFTIE